jgi:hypothetical protein
MQRSGTPDIGPLPDERLCGAATLFSMLMMVGVDNVLLMEFMRWWRALHESERGNVWKFVHQMMLRGSCEAVREYLKLAPRSDMLST